MLKAISTFTLLIFTLSIANATILTGRVTDIKGEPLPFANVFIEKTTKGTTTNKDGFYTFELQQGEYDISFKMLGFKKHTEHIVIGTEKIVKNITLYEEVYTFNEVVINSDAEDPAYAIIRKAIKKRKYYRDQVEEYSCDVYIKGVQRITDHPKKFLGQEVDVEGEIDTTTGIVYLSESVSQFNFKQSDKIKEVMVSSKVSGDNKAFSYNRASDMLFNFYENLIEVDGLSERGFVSPISNNALFFYKYKLIGSFYENGEWVNKIEVTPKRKNDPVFRGYIYIVDNSWRIHSTNLFLTKDAQIDFVDTLYINQTFLPVDKDVWMVFQNIFTFHFSVLGFKGNGTYVGVNANYNVKPNFPKKFFTGEEMKVTDDANKKDTAYWKETRPVPLTKEEENDYRKRDSLEKIRNSKPYLDSIDRISNKITFGKLFLNGYQYYQRYKKRSTFFAPLIQAVQFNTVQGLTVGLDFSITKELEKNRFRRLFAKVYYGFSNTHFNAEAGITVNYKQQKFSRIEIKGGLETTQFNNNIPIMPIINTYYTLFDKKNYAKYYEQWFAEVSHRTEVINGLMLYTNAAFYDRLPLMNTSNYTIIKKDRPYSSNDPIAPQNDSLFAFNRNQSFVLGTTLRIRFKQKYYTRPYQKIITGSKYPQFNLEYKIALPTILGSDINYQFARISVNDEVKLKLFGTTRYYLSSGIFFAKKKMEFMDFHHFNGNQTMFSTFALHDFNLLPYYNYSTNQSFVEAHIEHSFGGFILNKLPLIRKLKLNEVAGVHYISCNTLPQYAEFFVGIEKLKVMRFDFVTSFQKNKNVNAGIRFGLKLNSF